eukprot:748337-Hanusia_phi.AAC.3
MIVLILLVLLVLLIISISHTPHLANSLCFLFQWLIWDLERYHKQLLPEQIFNQIASIAVNNTADLFEWYSPTCRYLTLHESAEEFAKMNQKCEDNGASNQTKSGGGGGGGGGSSSSSNINIQLAEDNDANNPEHRTRDRNNRLKNIQRHNYYIHNHDHNHNHNNNIQQTSIVRIGLAGTSRMRGLLYSLLNVCNVTQRETEKLCRGSIDFIDRDVNVEHQNRRMEVSFFSTSCNIFVDYAFVTGSVWGEFSLETSRESFRCNAMSTYLVGWLEKNQYCRKQYTTQREIFVLSVGFWESLENSFPLLQECGEYIFGNLMSFCEGAAGFTYKSFDKDVYFADSSTFIIYKNEEATPSYRWGFLLFVLFTVVLIPMM